MQPHSILKRSINVWKSSLKRLVLLSVLAVSAFKNFCYNLSSSAMFNTELVPFCFPESAMHRTNVISMYQHHNHNL